MGVCVRGVWGVRVRVGVDWRPLSGGAQEKCTGDRDGMSRVVYKQEGRTTAGSGADVDWWLRLSPLAQYMGTTQTQRDDG